MNGNFMDLIENRRLNEQITVSELCRELDIDESDYSLWVKDPDRITLSNFRKLMKRFGLTCSEIKKTL